MYKKVMLLFSILIGAGTIGCGMPASQGSTAQKNNVQVSFEVDKQPADEPKQQLLADYVALRVQVTGWAQASDPHSSVVMAVTTSHASIVDIKKAVQNTIANVSLGGSELQLKPVNETLYSLQLAPVEKPNFVLYEGKVPGTFELSVKPARSVPDSDWRLVVIALANADTTPQVLWFKIITPGASK